MFINDGKCAQNVVFFYNQWQDLYTAFKAEKVVKHWINEPPTIDVVTDLCHPYKDNGGSIIIVDDFQNRLGADVQEMFTTLSHHLNFVIILLVQNIFPKNRHFRDISLNAKYVIVFKSPRDQMQIRSFAKQIEPGNTNYIVQSFAEATKKPYSYLFFDLHQETKDILRIRSNILQKEFPIRIWTSKTC